MGYSLSDYCWMRFVSSSIGNKETAAFRRVLVGHRNADVHVGCVYPCFFHCEPDWVSFQALHILHFSGCDGRAVAFHCLVRTAFWETRWVRPMTGLALGAVCIAAVPSTVRQIPPQQRSAYSSFATGVSEYKGRICRSKCGLGRRAGDSKGRRTGCSGMVVTNRMANFV